MVALVMVIGLHGISNFSFAEEAHPAAATEEAHEQHAGEEPKKGFDAKEVILGHVKDAHDWHFFSMGDTHVTIPLPVILYSPTRGLSVFSSSKFHHGHESHDGYRLVDQHYVHEKGLDPAKYPTGTIIAVDENNNPVEEKFYDFSMTKNITSMIIAAVLLLVIMLSVAKAYKTRGSKKAPKGLQSLLEPVIIFIRDEVVKPNIPGKKAEKFTPFILTVFFFILINNLLGLLPGSANVTGNLAVTFALALISFIVTMLSTSKHFWAHILNPPVPFLMKFILAPVELIGVFTKPVSLMIRLFANIMAGHIIILSIISLVFIFGAINAVTGYLFLPVTIGFNIVMMMLELLVAFIQAFIFANLTAVFIGQSMEGAHDEAHHH
ncbi:F-type H+-transporting ATPase subunit a [Chitinophaga terrae (ex Kim and Jung 2007)]|uniref:F0F1 ATP synthase subunit A n=1 Tax=Chitinophaga terrae (ex Kim and Jung 2007) TaxID=408074 RepID=UPI0027854417|nr:F0F1 ATP synthase subunit A [Chitinophaga terrae (ex Kim and Jung 2007)]MDQ0108017.1 F-type H+-transporting ATPase subunit a [Chitinophaga terrae (ex Kim and Jung 2007)]